MRLATGFKNSARAFGATTLLAAIAVSAIAVPAVAAEEATPDFKVSGTGAVVTDYRLRGVSQSDKGFAAQLAITAAHKSGLYAGIFSSSLAGWGTFGGPNIEFDLIGGFKFPVGNGAIDAGLTWYMYPGGADKTDYAEPFAKISGTLGPVSLLGGIAYAPSQQALGRWYFTGARYQTGIPNAPFAKNDNLYLWADISGGIPKLPLTLKAHVGYSDGNPGLGPNGTSIAPTGKYWDYLFGVDWAVYGPIVFSINFAGTDISEQDALYLQPNLSSTKDGSSIVKGKLFFQLAANF